MPLAPSQGIEQDPIALKRRFKVRCADTKNIFQNWQIRVHRSLSWSIRANQLAGAQPEAELLFHWIALNSLYARWDNMRNTPDVDHSARDDFLRTFASANVELTCRTLQDCKPVVRKLLGSPYLSNVFWREPSAPNAKKLATAEVFELDRLLRSKQVAKLLKLVLDRVYVFRGQLVHGASSGGSKLNRTSLDACLQLMRIIVPLMQHLVIEFGAHDDWPDLCYPPVE